MTDHGPLYILGMPLFRTFAVMFDRNAKTISLAKVSDSKACDGCGADAASGMVSHEAALATYVPRVPVQMAASKLRLPWWAVKPELRPANARDAVGKMTTTLNEESPSSSWMIKL